MTMTAANFQTRGDFRCEICRQRSVFHCEHDTPYRDQYLGTFDQSSPRNYIVTNRRSKSETRMPHHSAGTGGTHTGKQEKPNTDAQHHQTKKLHNPTSNGGINTGRQGNSNAGAQHHQGKKLKNPTVIHTNPNGSSTQEPKKSKGGCVIL